MGFLLPKAGVQRPIIAFVFILIFIMSFQQLSQSLSGVKQLKGWPGYPPGHSLPQAVPQAISPEETQLGPEDIVILTNFTTGTPKPPGSSYTRTLVMPRLAKDNVDWIDDSLGDIKTEIYVVDDPNSVPRTPMNKGREAMAYLTYLIDNYDNLPDIIIFMHSHRTAWHNEEPLSHDSKEMIKRLSNERVTRDGFMNLRCNWAPGCPDWLHPQSMEEDKEKPEQPIVANGWRDIFPSVPVPEVLAGQCCAQFALSRERALAVPRTHFIYYRDWLLRTTLTDFLSGRVWEYLWHVIFTGQNVYCPAEQACFCDGYGLCFEEDQQYFEFMQLGSALFNLRQKLKSWHRKDAEFKKAKKERNFAALVKMEAPQQSKREELEQQLLQKSSVYAQLRDAAFERGQDPRVRARVAGRPWAEGDGF
ncbi:hypothetical protein McanMca71_001880 [Microsporum canis]